MSGTPVVIDNGSLVIKAGLAGDEAPRIAFRNVVGVPRYSFLSGSTYIGEDAIDKRSSLRLSMPISAHGNITNSDHLEKVWKHAFNELQVAPEEHPVLLTEAPLIPNADREKMTQIMFETFNTPAMYMKPSSVLSLNASGRTTGLVLDSGNGFSHIVPIRDSLILPAGVGKFEIAGRGLTNYLIKLLAEKGIVDQTPSLVCDLKENLCYVAQDFEHETATAASYEVFDGQTYTLEEERFRCPEILFKPSLAQKDSPGVHELINKSIMDCDEGIRRDLYGNIVLAGGNTMLSGLPERLYSELDNLDSGMRVKVIHPPERYYAAFIGGSLTAGYLDEDSWISRKEYDESGPTIVNKKCAPSI